MTGSASEDDYQSDDDRPEADEPPRQLGLSRAVVDEIRSVVLGTGDLPDGRRLLAPESVDAARTSVLSGEHSPRKPSGRFEKGSSGNPKGRPKRMPAPLPPVPRDPVSLGAIALRHVMRSVKARTADGQVNMTLLEAIIVKNVQDSVKGNPGQTRTLMTVIAKAEAADAAHHRDLFRYWSEMRLLAIKVWTEAKQAGRPRPMFVHPDDIRLNADGTVTLLGPTEASDIVAMRHTYSKVEYHLINMAYQQWLRHRWQRIARRPGPQGTLLAELEFEVEQGELPPRLRLTSEEISKRKAPYAALAGRALHLRLKQEAAKFGLRVPPRELRRPTIIDPDALDDAEQEGLSKRAFLEGWLNANPWAAKRPRLKLKRTG